MPPLPSGEEVKVISMFLWGLAGGLTIFALRALAKSCSGMSLVDLAKETRIRWRLPDLEDSLPRVPLRDPAEGILRFDSSDSIFAVQSRSTSCEAIPASVSGDLLSQIAAGSKSADSIFAVPSSGDTSSPASLGSRSQSLRL
jgi:hypothetical protein